MNARFAIILSTRNRPQYAQRAVRSILSSPTHFTLLVIDQSDDSRTADALIAFAGDPRMRILRHGNAGLAKARNVGWRSADAEILAFTDDDCEPCPLWLEALGSALDKDERIGVAFGTVLAPAYDRTAGFIMAYTPPRSHVVRHIREKARIEGVGACMAIRRSVLVRLGGFDEELGAGARLGSAEDSDLAMRALLTGHYACETLDAAVVHHGFHAWDEARLIVHNYMVGLGAANAKMLRLGKLWAIPPLIALALRWLLKEPVADLNHRPPHFARMRSFLEGFWAGLITPLDSKGHFKPHARGSNSATQQTNQNQTSPSYVSATHATPDPWNPS